MPLGGIVAGGGAAAGGIGGAVIGGNAAASQLAAATAARQQAVQQWLSINVPDPEQQQIELQNYQVTGTLSPQLEQAFQQSQTGLKNMQIDPASRSAEVQALEQMQNISEKGGLDDQALQDEQQSINAANTNEQGQRGAITQSFAQRGEGGAGAQMAAELEASQGDANQAAASGLSAASGAEQRSLQAMAGAAGVGATLNAQDYNQAANEATAQDAINNFNTQNKQAVSNSNVSNLNQAQAANLANEQSVANANTGLANEQEISNKALLQQQFQNEATVAGGVTNADTGVASQANTNATAAANQWAGIGSAVGQGTAAFGQYANSQAKNGAAPTTSDTQSDQMAQDAENNEDDEV